MKNEQTYGKKILAPVAAAIALSVGASAQFAGSAGSPRIVEGRPVFEVSLEGDLRDAQPVIGRKIVLSRDDERELELKFKMRPHPGVDPLAVVPTLDEMEMTLLLSGGTAGGMAVIHLDTRAPEVRAAGGGVRIVGFFDANGLFERALPEGIDLRGVFAWGEQILAMSDLVKKDAAGSAARTTQRPVLDELPLGNVIGQAYFNWVLYWTDLQVRSEGRLSADPSFEESASLLAVASSPIGTQRVAQKIELERPRTPSRGHGHAQQGSGVEGVESGTNPEIPPVTEFVDPQGGQRAGEKIRLRRPAHRDNNVLQHRL